MKDSEKEIIKNAKTIGEVKDGKSISEKIERYSEAVDSKQIRKYTASTVFLIGIVLLCGIIAVQVLSQGYASFFGYSVFRVATGSMEPTMPVGTVTITKKTEIWKIKEKDIVCFKSEEPENFGMIITHRVVQKDTDALGIVKLQTKGDANPVSDAYQVTERNLIGVVISYSGEGSVLTKMLSFITGKIGFMACIVFPVLLIAGLVLQSVVKSLRKDLKLALIELNQIGSSPERELLPGYETLTKADYEKLYREIKSDIVLKKTKETES